MVRRLFGTHGIVDGAQRNENFLQMRGEFGLDEKRQLDEASKCRFFCFCFQTLRGMRCVGERLG